MRLMGETITVLLVMIFTMASMALAQQQPAPEMSYRQAQRVITAAMSYATEWDQRSGTHPLDQSSVRLTKDTLEFDSAKGVHYTIPLKDLRKVTADCEEYGCEVIEEGNKKSSSFLTNYNAKKRITEILFGFFGQGKGKICSQAQNHDECMNATAQFATALNSLHIYSLRPTLPEDDFHKRATAWRGLAEKPALPDAARVRRLLAEDAIKNKKPEEALTFYEQALEAYSTWPEGWFNAALVAGELGRYDDAADNMQNYLELVPDAKDAQAARDQLEMWKIRAQTKK
jgi:tetratricopeptide (TPR) repeat protein